MLRQIKISPKTNSNILLFILCVFYSSVFVTSNIGFDLRDEGFYFAGYNHTQSIFFELSSFHFLIRILPGSDDIVYNRIYRLLILTAGSFILAKSLYKTYFKHFDFKVLLLWILLGNALTYIIGPSSLSYNHLNIFFIQCAFSIYVLLFSGLTHHNKIERLILLILFSMLLALMAINKATSALLFLLLFLIDTIYIYRNALNKWLLTCIFIGVSSLLFYVLMILEFYGKNIKVIYALLVSGIYNSDDPHLNFLYLFEQLTIVAFSENFISIFFISAYLLLLNFRENILSLHYGKILYTFIFSLLFFASIAFYQNFYFDSFIGSQFFYSFFIATFLLTYRSNAFHYFKSRIILWLLILPIVGYIGSDVSPFLGGTQYMIFSLLVLLYCKSKFDYEVKFLLPIFLSVVCLYIYFFKPYSNPSLFTQNKLIELPNRKIYVSEAVYYEYNELKTILPYLKNKNNIINIGTPIGCLYLLNLTNYFSTYFNAPFFIARYIKLIKEIGLPDQVEILYYNNAFRYNSANLKKELISIQEYMAKKYVLIEKRESKSYTLYYYEKIRK
jgi:hypothetical protein